MRFEINVQLGSLPIEGRIARFMIEAPDMETAKSIASGKAYDEFCKRFGKDNPILSKTRIIRLCEPKEEP